MTIYLNASQTLQTLNTSLDNITGSYNSHTSNTAMHLTTAQNTLLDAITVTATEINYLSGVTANIQTQINNLNGASSATSLLTQLKTVDGAGSRPGFRFIKG